jgi:hypothetical protein
MGYRELTISDLCDNVAKAYDKLIKKVREDNRLTRPLQARLAHMLEMQRDQCFDLSPTYGDRFYKPCSKDQLRNPNSSPVLIREDYWERELKEQGRPQDAIEHAKRQLHSATNPPVESETWRHNKQVYLEAEEDHQQQSKYWRDVFKSDPFGSKKCT